MIRSTIPLLMMEAEDLARILDQNLSINQDFGFGRSSRHFFQCEPVAAAEVTSLTTSTATTTEREDHVFLELETQMPHLSINYPQTPMDLGLGLNAPAIGTSDNCFTTEKAPSLRRFSPISTSATEMTPELSKQTQSAKSATAGRKRGRPRLSEKAKELALQNSKVSKKTPGSGVRRTENTPSALVVTSKPRLKKGKQAPAFNLEEGRKKVSLKNASGREKRKIQKTNKIKEMAFPLALPPPKNSRKQTKEGQLLRPPTPAASLTSVVTKTGRVLTPAEVESRQRQNARRNENRRLAKLGLARPASETRLRKFPDTPEAAAKREIANARRREARRLVKLGLSEPTSDTNQRKFPDASEGASKRELLNARRREKKRLERESKIAQNARADAGPVIKMETSGLQPAVKIEKLGVTVLQPKTVEQKPCGAIKPEEEAPKKQLANTERHEKLKLIREQIRAQKIAANAVATAPFKCENSQVAKDALPAHSSATYEKMVNQRTQNSQPGLVSVPKVTSTTPIEPVPKSCQNQSQVQMPTKSESVEQPYAGAGSLPKSQVVAPVLSVQTSSFKNQVQTDTAVKTSQRSGRKISAKPKPDDFNKNKKVKLVGSSNEKYCVSSIVDQLTQELGNTSLAPKPQDCPEARAKAITGTGTESGLGPKFKSKVPQKRCNSSTRKDPLKSASVGTSAIPEPKKQVFIKMNHQSPNELSFRCTVPQCNFAGNSRYSLSVHSALHEITEVLPPHIKALIDAIGLPEIP